MLNGCTCVEGKTAASYWPSTQAIFLNHSLRVLDACTISSLLSDSPRVISHFSDFFINLRFSGSLISLKREFEIDHDRKVIHASQTFSMDIGKSITSTEAPNSSNFFNDFSVKSLIPSSSGRSQRIKDTILLFCKERSFNETSTSKKGTPFGWRSSFPAMTPNKVAKSRGFLAIGPVVDNLCKYKSSLGSLGTKPQVGRIP